MITVTLMAADPMEAVRQALEHQQYASGVELRLDCWLAINPEKLVLCLGELKGRFENVVLTVRLPRDGGKWSGTRKARNSLLLELIPGLQSDIYLDLEIEQINDPDDQEIVRLCKAKGFSIIRSSHCFDPGINHELLDKMGDVPSDELPKIAIMPSSTSDLLDLLKFARSYRFGNQIVLGMGEWGLPSRLCPAVFGSRWTYAAAAVAGAPGQLDASELAGRFFTHRMNQDSRYFAIFGNPVSHSRSPDFHNPIFQSSDFNAGYILFPLSRAENGARVIREWPLCGASITVPHKQGTLLWPGAKADDAVKAVGAANTVVTQGQDLLLFNTDVEGFLSPLRQAGFQFDGARCVVIGAGGAGRAAVYGLAKNGAQVLIVNRTVEKAQKLASQMRDCLAGARVLAESMDKAVEGMRAFAPQLIVQTTDVGMEPDVMADPLPDWSFSGDELVYDIIYTPPQTSFLGRALAAGCRIINGQGMFDAQAAAQSRLFLDALAAQ
ncbi:MAG: type I 3-dehydroquinate dehydratase [Spirochaetaceae bacterium]|nr:MAG: type I 3-dehydroquinate dehydratase [Spirochaetaceae bacterium]